MTGVSDEKEVLLIYEIEKTGSLEFWESTDKKLKILAGNLGVKPNEVVLYEGDGAGELEIKLNDIGAEIWNNKNNIHKVTFLGGDIEIAKASSVKFYFPKKQFEFAREVLDDFVHIYNDVTGRPLKFDLLFVPIDLELGDLKKESALAEALETKNPGKFSKQYSSFVEREVKSSLVFKESFWWTKALVNYLSYFIISDHKSDFGFVWLEEFFLDVIQNEALEKDAYESSLPLKNDHVLPEKGFAVMHSLSSICGYNKFVRGVKNCLNVENYDLNTIVNAFENCFENSDEAGKFFSKSVDQSGYPVLFVEESTEDKYKIHQEQFFLSENKGNNTWVLPVTYMTKNSKGKFWLSEKEGVLEFKTSNFLFINPLYEGYYRVNYPKHIWDAIIEDENKTETEPLFRAQIINDIFSFSKSTNNFSRPVPDYDRALKLIKYLGKEKEYAPVKAAFDAFEFLESALTDELNSKFKSFIEPIVKDLYNNFPLNKTSESLLAREVGFWACRLGIESCIKHAEDKLKEFKGLTSPNPGIDLLEWEVPFCVGIRNGSEDLWKKLLGNMENMNDGGGDKPEESSLLINILGCTKNDTNLMSLIETIEMKHYGDDACRGILRGNPENVKTVLQYLIKNKKPPNAFRMNMARRALSRANKDNLHLFTELREAWKIKEISNEVKDVTKHRNEWSKKKLSLIRNFLSSGEIKTPPIALIVLFSALLPFLNSVFK